MAPVSGVCAGPRKFFKPWTGPVGDYTIMVYDTCVAEKRKPTYDLNAFKAAFDHIEKLRLTGTALKSAAALGFGRSEIVATIQTMKRSQFYKSMTSYADYRVWQDVYHVPSEAGLLYVKFTADAVTEFLLLSFKEKDNG
jgi:motility quorum-sensing regulator / GCU-specific mRNA interferase toxin